MLTTYKSKTQSQIRKLVERRNRGNGSAAATKTNAEISLLEDDVRHLDADLKDIHERIKQRDGTENGDAAAEDAGNRRMPNESQRDFLIRTGKITPFSKMPSRRADPAESTLEGLLFDAEEEEAEKDFETDAPAATEALSHRNLLQPGFSDDMSDWGGEEDRASARPTKRRRLEKKNVATTRPKRIQVEDGSDGLSSAGDDENYIPEDEDDSIIFKGQAPEVSDDDDEDEDSDMPMIAQPGKRKSQSKNTDLNLLKEDLTGIDDGNEKLYQKRLRSWIARRSNARARNINREATSVNGGLDASLDSENIPRGTNLVDGNDEEEWHLPHPTRPDHVVEAGFKIPGDIFPSLFNYQQTGVQWLWELYSAHTGGIVGDEMGLGKTIQVIAFLAGLHYSKKVTKPILIVAPATVMKQWVNEFHTWWPPFRVSILHSSGAGMHDVGREAREEDELLMRLPSRGKKPLTKAQKSAKQIVNRVARDGHILVTTYSGLQTYADLLIPMEWEYAVLDEGHKIRNPNTAITIHCKELRTANRIILSGTPMQNNLEELWSLFDFVYPMRLGTLVNFRNQFEFPIRQGGYANATNLQIQTALKCAETLKDAIAPYLLQRLKADVASDLPKKTEQVLFCKLTKFQRETYENFLASDEFKSIMAGKRQMLYGVDILRKICNHPDLQEHKTLSIKANYNYGSGAKSGKMQVVKALLELWKEQGHKTLLFAQHRIMLDILEKFIKSMGGFNYRRMDGTTPIPNRQSMVDEFNNNPDAHVFLLTTKVGGLGVNLTGADRVIIYDPDWNPSTDIQARERAWRLGQKREVMIYRLMTAGTIEEKIYHRQLFKQFLINKIMKDPKQRQIFQKGDLHDLFTLGSSNDATTETGHMFKGTEVQFEHSKDSTELVSTGTEHVPESNGESSSVRNLNGVSSLERFEGEEEEERKAAPEHATNSESRVMESIFARSGVQSALEHDQIVNGKRKITADPKIIEEAARKVAGQAAQQLRAAGQAARLVPVGTPTWTGQFGVSGRPEPQARRGFGRGRGGPASSTVLAGLQNRQNLNGQMTSSGSSTPGTSASEQAGVELMKTILNYLRTHGGQVYSQMLVDHFRRQCNTPQKAAEFKEMLNEIATLEKGGSTGRGKWMLKDVYR